MFAPIIHSILDTDFYKLTMQQVVFHYFPDAQANYVFINRDKDMKWPAGFAYAVRNEVENMGELSLREDELQWLSNLGYFKEDYLGYLLDYTFDSDQVDILRYIDDTKFSLSIKGPWRETILWEVPLLAIISELYYKMSGKRINNLSLSNIWCKEDKLWWGKCKFIDFGTRRRFSHTVQDVVNEAMSGKNDKSGYLGTSNPYFAMKYGVNPQGTYAHEAIMAMQGQFPQYECQNDIWMNLWHAEYGDRLQVALTDTLTTKFFLQNLSFFQAVRLTGFRQDSGEPEEIANLILEFYAKHGIDAKTKMLVFSDGLNVDKVIDLQRKFGDKINCVYGIGTNLTNDCGHTPLNIVIKLRNIKMRDQWKNVIKLSDVEGKETGSEAQVQIAKSYIKENTK